MVSFFSFIVTGIVSCFFNKFAMLSGDGKKSSIGTEFSSSSAMSAGASVYFLVLLINFSPFPPVTCSNYSDFTLGITECFYSFFKRARLVPLRRGVRLRADGFFQNDQKPRGKDTRR